MAINLLGDNSSTYKMLKEGIQASTLRGKAISNNIANINTKGYKRFNVVFEENLTKSNGTTISMKRTDNKHISDNVAEGNITITRDKSTSMRTDGNNVDLDVEKVNQAANTLKYNALIQQANGKLSNVKYVISGGR